MDNTLVSTEAPKEFTHQLEVVACYIEYESKIALFKRANHKDEAGLWGSLAGKVEPNEEISKAMIREIYEEASLKLDENEINYLGVLYIQKPQLCYLYHVYHYQPLVKPDIYLNNENEAYDYFTFEEIQSLPLMKGALGGIQQFKYLSQK